MNTLSEQAILGIEAYSLEGIYALLQEMNLPSFRAKQLVQWIYSKGVHSYDEMTNLPKAMRANLKEKAPLNIPSIADKQISQDGSRKYVLELADGARVESVGIPSIDTGVKDQPRRLTVCFSTQVGCPMQCAFCATGQEGLTRNLLPGEIAQQILCVQRDFGMKVSNVVAMGQGEPFLNYDNFIDALHIINSPEALNIGARHITVSSCGILDGIERFGKEKEQFTLAISLHAARQDLRDELMPRCKSMPLSRLKQSLCDYYAHAGRRISFEYLLIDQVNDTKKDLDALINYCKGLPVYINLIPLNKVDGNVWKPSKKKTVQQWLDTLEQVGIAVSLRNSRGKDIDGACGQLKNKRKA